MTRPPKEAVGLGAIIEELREELDLILHSAGEGIFGLDVSGRHTFVNPAAAAMLGYGARALLGRRSHPLWHHLRPDRTPYPEKECPIYAAYKDGRAHSGEDQFIRKDGTFFPVEYTSTPMRRHGKLVGAVVVFRDISERTRFIEELKAQSLVDELTGVHNRRGFFVLAAEQLKLARRLDKDVAVLFADVDDLKRINDLYGHREGDAAIRDAATLLKRVFRDADIVGRFGGDEFVVLAFADQKADGVAVIKRRIQLALDAFNAQRLRPYALSLSLGVIAAKATGRHTIEGLVERADRSMYSHKKARRKSR